MNFFDDSQLDRVRAFAAGARKMLFVSEANWRLFETQIGMRLDNAGVVRNPFNVSYAVTPKPAPAGPGEPARFACVGRVHPPSKGQDLLIEALSQPAWLERDWTLSIYGGGPFKRALQSFAEMKGVAERIAWRGMTDDIGAIWDAHDMLLLPSRFEGLPLVIVEAMLCGRPVMSTAVAGAPEVISDGDTGFLAEAPTIRHVSDAMERVWASRADWGAMGARAHAAIRTHVPEDPAQVFADFLMAEAQAT